ncbi:hypothetical protein HETIRDRAFT_450545 [Heterobasidion irregulare TC 32-1]|uniref:Uncharacterized protein n=1 Tax=Heterobasidion irregulare (strain TC 32-1) TaxID=747525 RepID=W4KCM2_HETIT|nr:uncharacterized protein HETIRDRAFT_450545 [Heterobasidion irregulare TC 32-1]ETW82796.1 hypothetical protein HETIRDRAFT_450545 [Heterobasidion irregulare TC 32-1]
MSSVFPLLSVSSSSSLLSPPLLSLSLSLVSSSPVPYQTQRSPALYTPRALRCASPLPVSPSPSVTPRLVSPPSSAPPRGARPCTNLTYLPTGSPQYRAHALLDAGRLLISFARASVSE